MHMLAVGVRYVKDGCLAGGLVIARAVLVSGQNLGPHKRAYLQLAQF